MRFLAAMTIVLTAFFGGAAVAGEQTMIVLDASGSMWGQIDGQSKMSIARETLDSVLKGVPEGNELGLMVYGHREKGSCADIELAVPPAKGTAGEISSFVHNIDPKGKTPLTEAVRQAAEALKYTEEKATVILVTDGLETCEADPCALGKELEKQGVDFTAHVVGFGLTAEEGKQVSCLAENTGGTYFQASDAPQLVKALTATVMDAPKTPVEVEEPVAKLAEEFNTVFDSTLYEGGPALGHDNSDVHWTIYKATAAGEPDGDSIDSQYFGAYSANYPAGKYVAKVTLDNTIERTVPFEVKDGEVTKPFMNFNAARVIITPKRTPEDQAADDNAAVRIAFEAYSTTFYGRAKFYAPAGELKLTGTIGSTTVDDSVTIVAGKDVERDLVIGSGVVMNKAVYLAGGLEVDSPEIFFEIVSATKDINGARKSFGSTYGTGTKLDSPAGDFVLTARLGSANGEVPYSIKAGEAKDVTVDINAGVLAVTAPNANKIEVMEAKKDIQGNQKNLTTTFGVEHKDTLPPGDYIVRVTYEGDLAPKDKPVTIKAGERSEVTVE